MATLLEETGVMNVLTGLLRKAFMALVLHASTSHAATSHINETNDDESSAQRDTEARRKIFWQRWRLVHDVYRLAREKYSSPLMRHSIEHAIHRNVLVYVRAAVTRRPTPEAIEALECVTDILRSIEDDYNLLHLLLDATFLMPSCAAAVSRMVASRDDRISIAALWAIHETIRLGDPSAVSDLMRSHKDSSYRLLDCSNSTANMPDSATIEQTLQISQRMLALSEMIDEGGALHASCASRKGPVMEYVRAAFDRCATRLELKEQYNTFFEGAQQSHAHALRRQIWAGVSHVGLLEQLMEQLSQPLTASFSRNLLVTSVLAQLIAMQDNVDLNRVLSNSNLPTVKRARHLTGYTLGSRNILQSLEQVTNDILNYADSVPAFDIRLKIARISPWRQNSQAAKKAGVSVVRPFGDGSFGGQGRPTPRRRVARCPTLSTIREANIESINMQAVSNTPIHAPQARRQPTIVKDSLPDAYQPVPVPPPRVLDSSTPPTPVPMDDDLNMERSFEHNAARARMNLAMMESDDDDESGSTEMPSQILKNEKEYTTEMNSNPTFKQQSFLTTSDSLVSNPITTTTTTAIATSNKMRRTTAARPKIRVKPPSPVSTRITRSSSVRDPRQPSVEQLVQTALVISEFCKEVACLILVKPLNRIVRCNEHWSKEQHEHYSQLTESLGLNRL
ncbi:hypothetical protein BDF19DRAFT_124364 [Syncephalis fuscata]|nr:hypothetical protein BDF19DRAFT_124364 [Syncephalis fuscata]